MYSCARTDSNDNPNLRGMDCSLEITAHLLLVSHNRVPLRTFSHTYINEDIASLVLQEDQFLFLGRSIFPQEELYSHFLSADLQSKNVWDYRSPFFPKCFWLYMKAGLGYHDYCSLSAKSS